MASSVSERVRKRRNEMRAAGLRPVQIWVPDERVPGFAEECGRQARIVAESDRKEQDVLDFLEAALDELGDEP